MSDRFITTLNARFDKLDDIACIRQRVTQQPVPDINISRIESYMIREKINALLSALYIPSADDLTLLSELVRTMKAHCKLTYASDKQYINQLYTAPEEWHIKPSLPICLTGPAGVGKTSLLRALTRLLLGPCEIELGREHGPIPIQSHWHAQVQGRSTAGALLKTLIGPQLNYSYTRSEKIGPLCAKAAYKQGVSFFALDELQFLTQSATANTAVTKFLYQIAYLGLPFVFVANYSLCRLLQRRPEQDRQRLLTKPRILLASTPESDDWADYLIAIQTALASSLRIDLLRERDTLYHFTAGLKRLVKQILVLAYDLAWQRGQRVVTPDDLRCAYDNTEYAMAREQVQAMLSPHTHHHKAYECPFPLPKVGAAVLAQRHEQALLKDISHAIQHDALPKAQRQALPKAAPPKPARSRSRRKVTPEELFETAKRRRQG